MSVKLPPQARSQNVLQISQSSVGNRLLSRFSPQEFKALLPHLEWVELRVRDKLYKPNKAVDYAYFPVSGVCSVIAQNVENVQAETGIIGREGFVGSSIVLHAGSSPFTVIVQVEGRALRISADKLRKAMTSHHGIHIALLKFTHVFAVQTSQTAVANGYYTIPQRLARWVVMCADRVEGDTFYMTHEFLSVMLAVRRSGVTVAINALEKRKLLKWTRGNVTILKRRGLLKIARGSYGVTEKEYKRLLS